MLSDKIEVKEEGFGYVLYVNGQCVCCCKCGCLSDKPILVGLCNDCCNGGHLIDNPYQPRTNKSD